MDGNSRRFRRLLNVAIKNLRIMKELEAGYKGEQYYLAKGGYEYAIEELNKFNGVRQTPRIESLILRLRHFQK